MAQLLGKENSRSDSGKVCTLKFTQQWLAIPVKFELPRVQSFLLAAIRIDVRRMAEKEKDKEFVNPIDPEKIAENPHLLPYAHERGGATIKAVDKGKIKGLAMTAMYEQTDMQLDQIKAQIDLLGP